MSVGAQSSNVYTSSSTCIKVCGTGMDKVRVRFPAPNTGYPPNMDPYVPQLVTTEPAHPNVPLEKSYVSTVYEYGALHACNALFERESLTDSDTVLGPRIVETCILELSRIPMR